MSIKNKERREPLDLVQSLLDARGRILRTQEETGKDFSAVLKDLDHLLKDALKGKSQEYK